MTLLQLIILFVAFIMLAVACIWIFHLQKTVNKQIEVFDLEKHVIDQVYDFAPIGFVFITADFHIKRFNKFCQKLFDRNKADIEGSDNIEPIVEKTNLDFLVSLRKSMEAGERENEFIIHEIKRHEKSLCCMWVYTIIRDKKGKKAGYFVMIKDITSEKMLLDQTRSLAKNNEEIRLQHDRFMANSMHSLKNLMTPLIAYTEMMMSDQLPKEKIPHVAEQLNRNTNLIVELCTELMNINRIRGGITKITFNKVNPHHILQEYIFMTEANFSHKQLHVVNNLDPEIKVLANADSVSSTFLNLLSNAVKFSYLGGCITINGKIIDNKYYAISVTDEGLGLPNDDFIEELNDKGAISRPGTLGEEGTGMGLILTKDLIEKNGGTLTAYNNPDKGATFTFTLLLANKESK